MRTLARPTCPVCGAAGAVRHADLVDRLFGAPGRWQMRACDVAACRTHWLDPTPDPRDLGEAYAEYYTHAADATPPRATRRRVIATLAHRRLGYPNPEDPAPLLAAVVGALPRYRELADFARLYLPYVEGGRLLDVGCGAGNQLALLAQAGWLAEGLDIDPAAVAAVQARGLHAMQGDLTSGGLPEAAYDAVTMIHVIEHVPAPRAHLEAALQRLKPGGRIVLVTPNVDALGHRWYGPAWRGLEPPRHLQLFSCASLHRVLVAAGFHNVAVRSSARSAAENLAASAALREEGGMKGTAPLPAPSALHRLGEMLERAGAAVGFEWGEELVATGRRPGH